MLVTGLPAYVLVKVLTPGFFARKDTRTPVYTALASLGVNIALNLLLIPRMGVAGLALAGSDLGLGQLRHALWRAAPPRAFHYRARTCSCGSRRIVAFGGGDGRGIWLLRAAWARRTIAAERWNGCGRSRCWSSPARWSISVWPG